MSIQDYMRSKGVRDMFLYKTLANSDVGFSYFVWQLKEFGLRVVHVQKFNKGRHFFIEAENVSGDRFSFYMLFKKDTFHSFNFEFKDFIESNPEFRGHGESINVEFLQVAVNKNALLCFVYEDGRIYFTYPKQIKVFCEKNNLVRTQDRNNTYKTENYSGTVQVVQERTYSFPFMFLQNFKWWKK